MDDSTAYLIVGVLILIFIFLVCRELLCWYWKINERRDILESINGKLNDLSISIAKYLGDTKGEGTEKVISTDTENANI